MFYFMDVQCSKLGSFTVTDIITCSHKKHKLVKSRAKVQGLDPNGHLVKLNRAPLNGSVDHSKMGTAEAERYGCFISFVTFFVFKIL